MNLKVDKPINLKKDNYNQTRLKITKETIREIINSVERHAFLSAIYKTNDDVYKNIYQGINIDEEMGTRGEKKFDDFVKELTIAYLYEKYQNNVLILNDEAIRFIEKHQLI